MKLFGIVTDVDDAAAGVVRELLHLAVATESHAQAGVKAAVGDEDDVDDGVGLLGSLGSSLQGFLRALFATVGEHDEDLATSFLAEFVMGSKVDGVVEKCAFGVGVAGD